MWTSRWRASGRDDVNLVEGDSDHRKESEAVKRRGSKAGSKTDDGEVEAGREIGGDRSRAK